MPFCFDSLDSTDFEYISKDIAEVLYGVKLTCYPAGRDGGIDASDFFCENYEAPKIIVQSKHWERTGSIPKLKQTLQALVKQLAKYAPSSPEFLLFTTLRVPRAKQAELHVIASEAGFTNFTIFEHTKINELLEEEQFKTVLKKHFKLWLSRTNILSEISNRDKFIDCEVFLEQASEQEHLFVHTSIFDEALQCLKNGHTVAIVGDPGTGKTTLSKMLVLYFAGDRYTVYYTTSNEVNDIKRLLSSDPEAKEIIVLDDFLGQSCLGVDTPQLRSISSLLAFIRKSKNRKIILNSRLTILNEARDCDRDFRKLMDDLDEATKITNTDRLSNLDRARILHSNLTYYGVPSEYIENVASNIELLGVRGYMSIVTNRNYNPRIIGHVCNKEVYSRVTPESFVGLMWSTLKNPVEVWRDEFNRRLQASDRILMYTLYSLTEKHINEEVLKEAYEKRAFNDGSIDTSSGVYQSSMTRANEALVRKTMIKEVCRISVLNPSINDYISSHISQADSEAAAIVDSAVYSDQVQRVVDQNKSNVVRDLVAKLIKDGQFIRMPSINSSTEAHFFDAIVTLGLIDDIYAQEIHLAINCLIVKRGTSKNMLGRFIEELLDFDKYETVPGIVSIFKNIDKLEGILTCLDVDYAASCYRLAILVNNDEDSKRDIETLAKEICKNKIEAEALNRFDSLIVQNSVDLAGEHFFYNDDEHRLDEHSADMDEFKQQCLDSLQSEVDSLFREIRISLSDEQLFPDDELFLIIESEARSIVEDACPFDWVFEPDSDHVHSASDRIHLEAAEKNMIDRLFADYINESQGM